MAIGGAEQKARIPYHRYAFSNPYNYTLMAGVAAASLLTGQAWLLIVGTAAEALWMLFAPDSKLLRRLWFDKLHAEHDREAARRELERKLASLPSADGERVARLEGKRARLLELARENQVFTSELMKSELAKLGKLVHDFAELAIAVHRHEEYLESADLRALASELRRHEALMRSDGDPEARELAQKNYAVLLRRQEKLSEIESFVTQARAQMDLIENTFQLLGDQIITMRSVRELDGQLDDLIDGVEAVRTTARETEALLAGVGR